MKPPSPLPRRLVFAALFGLAAVVGFAAVKKGDAVFSKRLDTSLLAEPNPLAAHAGKAGFAEKLEVQEVRGSWLRVKGERDSGWVFEGNVAVDKPSHAPSAGLTTVAASETDTVAAARPLSPAGDSFAERHEAGQARADIEWLDRTAANLKESEVEQYLRENKKGEFRP